ncbi:unnamed protein product [Parnassius mnemosyne]|uniref:Palmitoyltransferase n=1 Tax=Parnassius mnemosyne TaxID=213953 RepID=A0AAV1M9D6_9NEOP
MTTTILEKFFYICEKVHCYSTVFILTPGFLIFEMGVVRPTLIEIYKIGVAKQLLHVFLSVFCFINVTGNMIMSIISDCSINKTRRQFTEDGDFCELCKIQRPPKAWHCKECNVCILKRDHHCFFFSRCIGLYNRRYYLMYLVYIHISMVYSTYYNYYFVSSIFENHGLEMAIFRLLNPFLRYIMREETSIKDIYVFFFLLNVGIAIWSAILLSFHMRNVFRGLTAHEYREPSKSNWKENLLSVFGTKWYITLIWPFVDSPVIDDTDFIVKNR